MTEKYEFIVGEKCAYSITKMCQWLGVSRSGFYAWLNRPASATAERREELKALIQHAFEESDETSGYRRVHAELARWGITCGPELVRDLMRERGLVLCQPKPARPSLTEAATNGRIPNPIRRDCTTKEPGEKLVGDITYISTREGWLHLSTILDCHTKGVIG